LIVERLVQLSLVIVIGAVDVPMLVDNEKSPVTVTPAARHPV